MSLTELGYLFIILGSLITTVMLAGFAIRKKRDGYFLNHDPLHQPAIRRNNNFLILLTFVGGVLILIIGLLFYLRWIR